jgi:hypothetical protein
MDQRRHDGSTKLWRLGHLSAGCGDAKQTPQSKTGSHKSCISGQLFDHDRQPNNNRSESDEGSSKVVKNARQRSTFKDTLGGRLEEVN